MKHTPAMVAAMVLLCAVAGCSGAGDSPGAAERPPGATSSADAPATTPGSAPSPDAPTTAPGSAPSPGPATPGDTPVGSEGGSQGDGSEVIPQPQETAPRLDELYGDTPAAESLTDVPADGSAAGELVDGFPVGVIDLIPESTVTSSAVSADGRRVQVSLEATVAAPPEEVIGHYRARFAAGGFAESAVPAVPGTAAAAFSRSGDSLVVSSRTSDGTTVFSVTGVLVAQD